MPKTREIIEVLEKGTEGIEKITELISVVTPQVNLVINIFQALLSKFKQAPASKTWTIEEINAEANAAIEFAKQEQQVPYDPVEDEEEEPPLIEED